MNEICFSVEKFTYTKENDTLNFDFLPKLLKRRLGKLDKNVIFSLNKVYDKEVENIIFSSRYGEFERLNILIEQYKDLNEVSPNAFSSSVHNFSVGFFSILEKITVPTLAISCGKDSFSLGLLNAVLSKEKIILFCYAEEEFGIGLKINKNKNDYKIIKNNDNNTSEKDYEDFLNFIKNNKNEAVFPFYKIKRNN